MISLNPITEPRWATYTKAVVFLAPAICLWTFAVLYLLPKLQQICREAGVALPSVYQGTTFVADHLPLIAGAVFAVLVVLEWHSTGWTRYRRASIGGAVFVVNAAILTLITLVVVMALVAAPNLAQHAR